MRYFATQLEGCYGETLARFRPDPAVAAAVNEDTGFFPLGEVAAEWRHRRIVAHVSYDPELRFLDLEHSDTLQHLRGALGDMISFYGYDDLDVSTVRSGDRRLTRWISHYAFHLEEGDGPFLGGIRYLSRLNSGWECWAVFDDLDPEDEAPRRPVQREDVALLKVANSFGLRVF